MFNTKVKYLKYLNSLISAKVTGVEDIVARCNVSQAEITL